MKLNPEEYQWINNRMLTYDIRFQEIYDELLDHVVSAIEELRANADSGTVEAIFDQVIGEQFGGPEGIKKVSQAQAQAYRLKIHKMVTKGYSSNILGKSLIIAAPAVLIDLFVRDSPAFTMSVYGMIILVVLTAGVYIYGKLLELKKSETKPSLAKAYVVWQTFLPIYFISLLFIIPNCIDSLLHSHARAFLKIHPGIPIFLFCWVVLYSVSCYRVFKYENRITA